LHSALGTLAGLGYVVLQRVKVFGFISNRELESSVSVSRKSEKIHDEYLYGEEDGVPLLYNCFNKIIDVYNEVGEKFKDLNG